LLRLFFKKADQMLTGLKIATVARPQVGANSPTGRVRAKLLASIDAQIESVTALLEGKKDPHADKRNKPWFFASGGTHYTVLKYGTSPIPLGEGNAIEAGKELKDLLPVYEAVKKGVGEGELDDVLLKLSAERGRSRKGEAAQEEVNTQLDTAQPASARQRNRR
jgi:hypothetical protein